MTESEETGKLRSDQERREREEREHEGEEPTEAGVRKRRRRADKAAYLREKLEERAESEREPPG